MKYFFINSVYGVRSTGRIIAEQCKELIAQGDECVVAYARETIEDEIPKIKIGTSIDYNIHAVLSRIFDIHGLASRNATKHLIQELEKAKPDVIWLHNIHGYYLNMIILFDWLKKHPEIKKYWTLHDCWAFTGHCAYFTMAKCEKWKKECQKCPQLKTYPITIGFDHSRQNYRIKKKAFTGVENLTLITPSKWLADLTRESFLKEYPVKVINNKINTNIFRKLPSDFKRVYNIEKKFMVLGVAVGWEETKGYPDMLKLRSVLDQSFVLVMVGLTDEQIKKLPRGIIGIQKTADQKELAEIYSAADVFVNPTHQDNYPTVNLEARACGTPVVTYDVGGSPESAGYEYIVSDGDILGLAEKIKKIRYMRGQN